MKKLATFILGLSLILTACGSAVDSGTSVTTSTGDPYTYTYKTAEFQLEVPKEWEVVDSFTSEYPDGLKVAFRNNVKDSIFTANLTILKEDNIGNEMSYDFAQKKLADHEDTLINYKLITQEGITLLVAGAESNTILSTFEGKNETAGPTLNFMQTNLTKNDNAWTVTASYRPSEDVFVIEELDTMLRSFTLR